MLANNATCKWCDSWDISTDSNGVAQLKLPEGYYTSCVKITSIAEHRGGCTIGKFSPPPNRPPPWPLQCVTHTVCCVSVCVARFARNSVWHHWFYQAPIKLHFAILLLLATELAGWCVRMCDRVCFGLSLMCRFPCGAEKKMPLEYLSIIWPIIRRTLRVRFFFLFSCPSQLVQNSVNVRGLREEGVSSFVSLPLSSLPA